MTSGFFSTETSVITARVCGCRDDGLLVQLPGEAEPAVARWAAAGASALEALKNHAEVVVVLEQGDPARPIVIGVINPSPLAESHLPNFTVEADGRKLVVSAQEEISIRCGSGEITLRGDGKILIRGEDITSRARKTQKIKGGSVRIN